MLLPLIRGDMGVMAIKSSHSRTGASPSDAGSHHIFGHWCSGCSWGINIADRGDVRLIFPQSISRHILQCQQKLDHFLSIEETLSRFPSFFMTYQSLHGFLHTEAILVKKNISDIIQPKKNMKGFILFQK